MKRYAILLALLLLILLSSTAIAAGCLLGEEYELDIASNQTNPDIYENTIVYEDSRNGNLDIYMYDLLTLTETRVTSEDANQQRPTIYGNTIAWADRRSGNLDIYMCDLSKNGSAGGCLAADAKTAVTTESATQNAPAIYGVKMVWHDLRNGNFDIYMCDLSKNGTTGGCFAADAKTRITSSPISESYADIYESKIVWHTNGVDGNVFMCDLALNGFPGGCGETDQKTTISAAPGAQFWSQIYGNNITWQDSRNGNIDIYRYDLSTSTEYRITSEAADQNLPVVYGTKIVWQDGRNDASDIYMCDLALNGSPGGCLEGDAKTRVTSATGSQIEPAIYKDNVVWQDDRAAGAWDIYLNPLACSGLSNRVAWFSFTNNDSMVVSWGDQEGDGYLDLAVGNHYWEVLPATNLIYPNQTGHLSMEPAWDSGTEDKTYALAWGDIDRDGYLDLAIGNSLGPAKVYAGSATGLTLNIIFNSGTANDTRAIAFGDVDNDGDLDLAVGNYGAQNVIYENVDGNLTTSILWSDGRTDNTTSIAFGDTDDDGYLELAVGNDGQNNLLYDNVNGVLSATPMWNDGRTDNTTSIVFGDIDNDGYLELAVGNDGQNNYVYDNVNGVLATIPVWSDGRTADTESIAIADEDNDGYLELAVGNYNNPSLVYNNASGSLTTEIVWSDFRSDPVQSISWADVNNDGDLDLAVGKDFEFDLVYENVSADTGNPNIAPTAPATGLAANYSCIEHKISLAWGEGSDNGANKTPAQSLYYNIRVGTSTSANDVVSGVYGQSGEGAYYGNGMLAKFRSIRNKPNLGYYWAVQSIDGGLKASPWSAQYLAPDAPPMAWGATFDINEDAGFVNNLVDLWAYASDNSTADLNLVFSITSQSTPNIVNCVLDQNRYLDCTTVLDQNGSSDIGVEVKDECLQTDTTTFRINVIGVPDEPVADITAPANGANFSDVDNINFIGTAIDPQEGMLTGSALVWSSSIDGALGTGQSITTTLTPGAHTITLTATDSQGHQGTASIIVSICAQPRDDLVITKNTTLCASEHYIPDVGNDGVIKIEGNNLTLDCNNMHLYGDSAGRGIVVNGYIPAEWFTDGNTEGYLDANKVANNEAAFEASVTYKQGITIKNCEISGYEHGFVITGGDGITVENVTAHDNAGLGIGFQGLRNSSIRNNVVYGNGIGGIVVLLGKNNVTELNTVYGNTGTGIIMSTGRANITRNNNVHDNESGISIGGADEEVRDNIMVDNNTTENSAGINAVFSSGAQIVGNLVQNSQFGIRLLSSYGMLVADNNVENIAQTGIDVGAFLFSPGDMNSGTFERNRVTGSSKAGMHLTDSVFFGGNEFGIHDLVIRDNYFENPGVFDLDVDDKGTSYIYLFGGKARIGGGKQIRDMNVSGNSFMGGGVEVFPGLNSFCVANLGNTYGTEAQQAPGEC